MKNFIKATFLSSILLILSCYRDNICDCYKKKGCKTIYVIQNLKLPVVVEKSRYCPKGDYDNDPDYISFRSKLSSKYDSIQRLQNISYSISVIDSIQFDTLKRIKGVETRGYKDQGYFCRCYE